MDNALFWTRYGVCAQIVLAAVAGAVVARAM